MGWFHHIIQCERFEALEEIKSRQQETIQLYGIEDNEDSLAELDEASWDDWTSHPNLTKRYPPPNIDPADPAINWAEIGRFLVTRLSLELREIENIHED